MQLIDASVSLGTGISHQLNYTKEGETLFVSRAVLAGSMGGGVDLSHCVDVHSAVGVDVGWPPGLCGCNQGSLPRRWHGTFL